MLDVKLVLVTPPLEPEGGLIPRQDGTVRNETFFSGVVPA
jgi:hypothetical protein